MAKKSWWYFAGEISGSESIYSETARQIRKTITAAKFPEKSAIAILDRKTEGKRDRRAMGQMPLAIAINAPDAVLPHLSRVRRL